MAEKTAPLVQKSKEAMAAMAAMEKARAKMSCGVPERYLSQSFESFIPEDDKAARVQSSLKSFCNDFEKYRRERNGLVIVGDPGTGKTHLTCSMVLALIDSGYKAFYTSMPELTMRFRESYRSREISTKNIVDELVGMDFLVIDEIDLHGQSDTDYQLMYEIINGRYINGGKPTVVISNRPVADLEADLGSRLVSRILGGMGAVTFSWAGQSHRPASRGVAA